MSDPTKERPAEPSLDAQLRAGLIETDISRALARVLSGVFLLFIAAIPISQAVLERVRDEDSSLLTLFQRRPSAENLREFEHELEEQSYAKEFIQPRIQLLLSRHGRFGNQRTLIGYSGFLYYMPGLTHLAGPNFIDPELLRTRATSGDSSRRPDPRPAIFGFQRMLEQRGIALILFPVPDKTMLQPMQLHGRSAIDQTRPVANNVGWPRFVAELRARGVTVFDPTPARLRPGEAARFLAQDTHWTPAWMGEVASELARFVGPRARTPGSSPERRYRRVAQRVERVGDLVDLLRLPEAQALFRPQALTVQQVRDEAGGLFEADPHADVLLLGDSFTNVFSDPSLGWGEAAGLGPQLAAALGRSVDVIAQNDAGAFATRQALARALVAGDDRLQGKRIVIWEFAARELSVGDWKQIDWPVERSAKLHTATGAN